MKTIGQQINWDFEANGILEINRNGKVIYYEDSNGYWDKRECDSRGNRIYYETSNGYWSKKEYDSQGNEIYFESSYGGIRDDRPKHCMVEEIIIEGVKYKLVKEHGKQTMEN